MSVVAKGAGVAAVIATFVHVSGVVGDTAKHVGKDVQAVVAAVDRR